MKRSSRLSLALHALSHMSYDADEAQTSAEIAKHAGTNPVVVRRVLGKLREAGLVASERGHSGGWRLLREPENVTLADVYVALEESLVASKLEPDPKICSVERALGDRISDIMQEVEADLVARLSTTTIAEIQKSARL